MNARLNRDLISLLFIPVSVAFTLALAAAPAAAAPAEDRFDLLELRVEGNSVLPATSIETAVYPHLGEQKTIRDVEAARTALEKAYHDNGFLTVFVDIPEQKVDGGTVRLRVNEGQVERLRVSDARYYTPSGIRAAVPALAEGGVPYFPAVQQQLAQAGAKADLQVTPVLRPGRTPGKVEVDLKVKDQLPLHGNVELNDRYSANTSRTRLNANVRYDNLWQRGHSVSLGIQAAPQDLDESKVFSATYVMPVGRGDYLALYGVKSRSNIAAVGDINVIGNGSIVGLRHISTLRARPGFFHTLTAGLDYKDFKETVKLGADQENTPISYLPLMLAYEATLQGAASNTVLGAGINFSLRGLADDSLDCKGQQLNEFACKRYRAEANYATLRLDLKHTHTLPAAWSLYGRLSGQLASGPLISNEQFSAGGVDSVRGYIESTAMGDDGWIAGLELRAPPLAKRLSAKLNEFSLYSFAEGARLSLQHPLSGQTSRFDLLSAGVGLRFRGWDGVNGALDWAYPFEEAGSVKQGDSRVHFRLGYQW